VICIRSTRFRAFRAGIRETSLKARAVSSPHAWMHLRSRHLVILPSNPGLSEVSLRCLSSIRLSQRRVATNTTTSRGHVAAALTPLCLTKPVPRYLLLGIGTGLLS